MLRGHAARPPRTAVRCATLVVSLRETCCEQNLQVCIGAVSSSLLRDALHAGVHMQEGETPLHWITKNKVSPSDIHNGHLMATRILLKYGANAQMGDNVRPLAL